MGKAWWEASRESSGQAPDPAVTREAVVQVYGARAFSWQGAFGVHTSDFRQTHQCASLLGLSRGWMAPQGRRYLRRD